MLLPYINSIVCLARRFRPLSGKTIETSPKCFAFQKHICGFNLWQRHCQNNDICKSVTKNMTEKNPFGWFSVYLGDLLLCWEAVGNKSGADAICISSGTIRGPAPGHPNQGNLGYFHSPSFVIIPQFKASTWESLCTLGNSISYNRPLGIYVVYRNFHLPNTLLRKKGGSGAYNMLPFLWWCLYTTGIKLNKPFWHNSFINTKESFYCVKQGNLEISSPVST